jgi:hypothetical protein
VTHATERHRGQRACTPEDARRRDECSQRSNRENITEPRASGKLAAKPSTRNVRRRPAPRLRRMTAMSTMARTPRHAKRASNVLAYSSAGAPRPMTAAGARNTASAAGGYSGTKSRYGRSPARIRSA